MYMMLVNCISMHVHCDVPEFPVENWVLDYSTLSHSGQIWKSRLPPGPSSRTQTEKGVDVVTVRSPLHPWTSFIWAC
jgi:hypothetical protein